MLSPIRFFIFCGLFSALSLFAERQEIHISRDDGSTISGYFDRPDGEAEVPVVVFIDGSYDVSVAMNQEKLAARFIPRGMGLISLEKRGITADRIEEKEYRAHDCFEERLKDHALLLKKLTERKIPGCSGNVVLLGASEGGKIAPRLSLSYPSITRGIVLIASGGGFPFGKEMKYQSEQLIQQMGTWKRLSYKLRGAMFPQEIEQHYDQMLREPESLAMCGPKTWKWFASYLRYDSLADLLKVEAPIYMIHGEEDILVPIQSADLIQEAFDRAGKGNLHYARYKDLGHALTGREDVYIPMLDWIQAKAFGETSSTNKKLI